MDKDYKCTICGRLFIKPMPHKCIGNFRKRHLKKIFINIKDMTREEQIAQASIEYTMQRNPMCLGGNNFSDQVQMMNRNYAFEAGAKWADEHPDLSSLWHDPSEKPKGRNWIILCKDVDDFYWVARKHYGYSWKKYVESYSSTFHWAYIKDLLPKY